MKTSISVFGIGLLALLMARNATALCPVAYCEASIDGDFQNQETTPDEWKVKSPNPDSDVMNYDLFPLLDFPELSIQGYYLGVAAHPGAENRTIAVHDNILVPASPEINQFKFTLLVPYPNIIGVVVLFDNLGRVYYKEQLSNFKVGVWSQRSVAFKIKAPATHIRWRIDSQSKDSIDKSIVFRNLNVCVKEKAVSSVVSFGVNELAELQASRKNRLFAPWQGTGIIAPFLPGGIELSHYKVGRGTVSISKGDYELNRCYKIEIQLLGKYDDTTYPLDVMFGGSLLGEKDYYKQPGQYGSKMGMLTISEYKVCPTSKSQKLKLLLKTTVSKVTIYKVNLLKQSCKVSLMAKRSANIAPEEL